MNSGYLLKWLISVEVQDEERLTHPALLRSSTLHTPYSNDTSRVLLLLLLMYVNEKEWMLEGVSGGPLYSLKGRFPPSLGVVTLPTRIRVTRGTPRRTAPGLDFCTWLRSWPFRIFMYLSFASHSIHALWVSTPGTSQTSLDIHP